MHESDPGGKTVAVPFPAETAGQEDLQQMSVILLETAGCVF